MANYISSITIDQVMDAMVIFLTPFMQGGQIVRAQVNRVSLPSNPCAVLTELLQVDTTIPYADYQPLVDTATIHGNQRVDVQVDIYGSAAGEICKVIKSAFRTYWGFNKFPSTIKPLYTTDGIQAPLISGEHQYESRWTITVSLQYNPVVTVPQEFADEATVTGFEAADL